MTQRFTGRHMWMVMVGFFGLVIAVNFTMAWLASSTFGGTIVDNSYVASQKFNGWLADARAQKQLGWTPTLALDDDRHVTLAMNEPGFAAAGIAEHPLGRAPDVPLAFTAKPDGRLQSAAPLPQGRWRVRVTVSRGGQQLRLAQSFQ